MKKFITLLLMAFVAFAINAQVRTISKEMAQSATYYTYTGVAADVLNGSTVDTIQFDLFLYKDEAMHIYTRTDFALVGTADTTITVTLKGKVLSDDAYTTIATGTFNPTAAGSTTLKSYGTGVETIAFTIATATDSTHFSGAATSDSSAFTTAHTIVRPRTITGTITSANIPQFYRYLELEYIIAGNDYTGTGVKISKIYVKTFKP